MYGTGDPKKLAKHVRTKTHYHVTFMLGKLRLECRKELECKDMKKLRFVDMNTMDDLFLAGGTMPKDVMVKWMEYLKAFYQNDPYQYDKFKLFSNAFLIMSECSVENSPNSDVDFKKLYYYLYRVFNQYYVAKHHKDANTTKYLYELLKRVLEEIDYTSEEEKLAMYQIVSNWTSVNRVNSLKVYGNVNKVEPDDLEDTKPILRKPVIKVFQHPVIPSFNPLHVLTPTVHTE